jgi:hypothetical protein
METIKQITEDTFDELVTLIPNHIDDNASFDGNMFETYGEEVNFVTEMAKQNRVITIIEGDGESDDDEGEYVPNMYYVSGYHIVNRIGYLISEEPLPFDFEVKIEW